MPTTDADNRKVLCWEDFPACRVSGVSGESEGDVVSRIASCLRGLLEAYEESEFIKYLVLPSAVALSGYFQCAEPEIRAALRELERQGYEYETTGSAGPVMLWDPLIRRKPLKRRENPSLWRLLYQGIFTPSGRPVAG